MWCDVICCCLFALVCVNRVEIGKTSCACDCACECVLCCVVLCCVVCVPVCVCVCVCQCVSVLCSCVRWEVAPTRVCVCSQHDKGGSDRPEW